MIKAFYVIGRAIALWWREFILLTLFNLAWLALQVPIVTGPPATAAMYALARRVVDAEWIGPLDGWLVLRQMFLPAWKWGAVNLVIGLVLVVNFLAYWEAPGLGWVILRLLWGAIALVWFAINLFYWPFWLVQSDRRMMTTARNSLLLLVKRPAFGLTLAVISASLVVVSLLTVLPLVAVLMSWLGLIGVLAVDEELKRVNATTLSQL
ncbi:MAG TPA: DUF624 domain-containing protein [Anaerolineae bacterium]|nr:DUF624 domain-containing protein [Anaerolineae bacterium]